MVAVHGQPFVIRGESPVETLGGGVVVEPLARRIRRRDEQAVERLRRLSEREPMERVTAAMFSYGAKTWTALDLVRDAGLCKAEAESAMNQLMEIGALIDLPIGSRRSILISTEYLGSLEDRVLRALGKLHERSPRSSFVRRSKLEAELADLRNEPLVAGLIDRMATAKRLIAGEQGVALPTFEPKLTQAERRALATIGKALRDGGFSPPEFGDLVAATGQKTATVSDLLGLLVEEGQAVAVSRELYLDSEVGGELVQRVRTSLLERGAMTMAELRDVLGTTRKYAVPIGEYLDRIGLTTRQGDTRRLASS
jgi:selenocysteine-specific elongation factor